MNNHTAYEALCITLYAYRFGTISFLELIERLEALLEISDERDELHLDCVPDIVKLNDAGAQSSPEDLHEVTCKICPARRCFSE